MTLRTVGVKLTADISSYVSGMRRAADTTADFGKRLNQAASTGQLDAIADRAGAMGLALGGAAAYATKQFMDFDKQMSAVQAATHASGEEMEKLRAAAMKAGADTKYSATEAAVAIEELSKAGVSTADVLNGGLNGALSLASAGSMDVGEAAEIAASALTQFKLKGSDVPHVADLLAAAAGKAQGTVHDLGFAMQQAGLVASQTGLTIEETTGTLAAFASAGLTGSDAGTSFKQMLLMLQSPSEASSRSMEALGISLYDAQGEFMGMTNFANQLQNALKDLTPEARSAAMAQIFGADAVRAASIVYENGAAGIQEWITKTNDSGYAAETAALKTDNLAGDLERLKGSIDTLFITAGGAADGPLRGLVQGLEAFVDRIGSLPSFITGGVAALTGLGAAALLMGAGWVKARRSIAETSEELRNTGPAGARAATAMEATTKAAGRTAAAFAGLQLASAAVNAAFGENLNPKVEALGVGLERFAENGEISGEAARLLGKDFGKLDEAVTGLGDTGVWTDIGNGVAGTVESLTGLGNVFDDSMTKAKERLESVDQALAQMVANGKGEQAAAIFQKIHERVKDQGISMNEMKKILPGYTGSLETAAAGAGKTAAATEQLTAEVDQSAEAAKEAKEAFDRLFRTYMDADEAALNYQESLVTTTKTLREGTRTLDINKEAGRQNTQAILDRIKAIKQSRDATVAEGGAISEADKVYGQRLRTLRKELLQMGYNEDQVDALIGKYRSVPQKANTTFSTPGLPAADRGVKDYDKKLDALARKIVTAVDVQGEEKARASLRELLIQQQALEKGISISAAASAFRKQERSAYAAGGRVTGPGTGTSDSITAMLSNDEFVVKAASARKFGYSNLEHLNQYGDLPGFAGGGRVIVAPFIVNASGTMIPKPPAPDFGSGPAAPSGGSTRAFMERLLESRFNTKMWSGYRPGSRTLSGNRSYHSLDRAVDFAPIRAMAAFMYQNYKARLKEAITPYPEYNVHNGRNHRYTGAVWRQHAFGYGNAHNHFAMANGGTINEPIIGIGASGRTYSFGEYGPETVVPGNRWLGGSGNSTTVSNSFSIVIQVPPTANQAEVGRAVVGAIQAYERGSGKGWRS